MTISPDADQGHKALVKFIGELAQSGQITHAIAIALVALTYHTETADRYLVWSFRTSRTDPGVVRLAGPLLAKPLRLQEENPDGHQEVVVYFGNARLGVVGSPDWYTAVRKALKGRDPNE